MLAVSGVSLTVMLVIMLLEQRRSLANEHALRERGAIEPAGDVYRAMAWVYPTSFVVMAGEGAMFGPAPGVSTAIGVVVLVAAKALKYWAIGTLGPRWTFRVLVPPGAPLVSRGPYAFLHHPNYVAVIGELVGFAILAGARVSGPLTTILFSLLLRSRIKVENSALRHRPC